MKKSDLELEYILVDQKKEDEFLESPITKKVFQVFRILSFLIILVMIIQTYLINAKSEKYRIQALANISNFKVVMAERGVITDRSGKLLVGNNRSFNAFLFPSELPTQKEEKREALNTISKFFELDRENLKFKISQRLNYFDNAVLVSSNLSQEKILQLNKLDIAGIKIEEGFKRTHKDPILFSHLLGYTGLVNEENLKNNKRLSINDEIGKAGLEQYYDKYLRGENGTKIYYRDSLGMVTDTRVGKPPVKGKNITTFIDKEFQEYIYNRLSQALEELERDTGLVIALNPQNGEVLSLVGIPSFDSSDIAEYLTDESQPLFNRSVSGLYNPGSTIKPLVALAALNEGIITPEAIIYSAGYLEVPNPYNPSEPTILKDWKPHGWVDARSALARSSNVYFYEIGGGFETQKGLGITKLKEWWGKFNLDKITKIDLPNERKGFLPDSNWKEKNHGRPWLLGDTYNVSIGQGDLAITPIGLLNYISAIANGGKILKPRITDYITDEKNKIIFKNKEEIITDISNQISQFIKNVQEGMMDAIYQTYGTANLLSTVPMTIAGKTGSAQIENNTKTNAFFVGYGSRAMEGEKTSSPELAILVLVEDAKEGSLNTIPVAKDIFSWYYENRVKIPNFESQN